MHAVLAVHVEATTISVAHWRRLLDGELFATSCTIEWAVLMKRSFGFNALTCPRCERKMHVLATITLPSTLRRILEHLGLRAEPLTAAPARDPTWEQLDLGFDDDAASLTRRGRLQARAPKAPALRRRCVRRSAKVARARGRAGREGTGGRARPVPRGGSHPRKF
jgi:hypothetical protein